MILQIMKAAFKCTHCELNWIKTHLVAKEIVKDFSSDFLAYFEALKTTYVNEGVIYFLFERLRTF